MAEMNLYNFEDDEFVDSRYVLTSPRSLQACDMLGVKPAELLYKPLSEFQDELLPSGLPLRAIYDQYDDHEKSRQTHLRLCRDYRDKMIRDGMHRLMSPAPDRLASRTSLHLEDAGYKSDESHSSHHSLKNRSSAFNDAEPRATSSLQRQRTAKVIAEDLALKLCEPIATRSRSPTMSRPHSALAEISPSHRERAQRPRSTSPARAVSFGEEPRRTRSSLSTTTSDGYSYRELYKEPSAKRKSRGYTRVRDPRRAWTSSRIEEDDIADMLSKSLCLSDLSTWRPESLSGTHLRNQSLRRSLGYKNTSGRVTHRDERILEALHSKHESEVEQELSRSLAQIEWEEEKLCLQKEKDITEHRRRQLLANRIADADEQQAMLRERQYRDQEELRQSMVNRCEENEAKWKLSSDRQQYRKDLALTEKRRRSLSRKLSQERLLAEFEIQREAHLRNHQHKAEHQQSRASIRKDSKYCSDKMKKSRQNLAEKEKHEQQLRALERTAKKFNEELKSSLSEREAKAVLNQSRVARSRDYNLHLNAKERQQRFYKSKQNQLRMEEEMSDWQRSLKTRRHLLESKARLTAAQTVELKALRAQAEREERESKQRKSYSRLQEEAEDNRRDQKDAIVYKDTKMRLVQRHKDNVIGQVRSLAATSQRMREELRRKYGKDSFDKIALETELQNKVGRGPPSATKNKSTVILA